MNHSNSGGGGGGGLVMDRSLKRRCKSPPVPNTTPATTGKKRPRHGDNTTEIAPGSLAIPMSTSSSSSSSAVIEESSSETSSKEGTGVSSISPGGSADRLVVVAEDTSSPNNNNNNSASLVVDGGGGGEAAKSKSSLQPITPAAAAITTTAAPAVAAKPAGDENDSTARATTEEEEPLPLKSTLYCHLRRKYTADLSYMLVEFQKLERQLLGAGAQSTAGSIERREKLRSFIQHLEETIQQIAENCSLEQQQQQQQQDSSLAGKKKHSAATATSTATTTATLDSSPGGEPSPDKIHEENVQKLEEHILGSLLPVKDRLLKQLAAQQGAKHNPVGIGEGPPAPRDAAKPPTFLKKQQPAVAAATVANTTASPGSNLTRRLHTSAPARPTTAMSSFQNPPPTISTTATTTAAVTTTTADAPPPKVFYAGLALGSTQFKSSLHAAGSIHKIMVQHPTLLELSSELHDMDALTADSGDTLTKLEQHFPLDGLDDDDDDDDPHPLGGCCSEDAALLSATAQAAITSYEQQRRKWRRRRRRRRNMRRKTAAAAAAVQQQQQQKLPASSATSTTVKNKRSGGGPRKVEYTCALCNETYNSTCEGNPWWALTQQECLKCHKSQIPKVDIGAAANAIEYHPALLAHADDAVTATAAICVDNNTEVKMDAGSSTEGSMSGSDLDLDDDNDDDEDDLDDVEDDDEESMFTSDDDESSEDFNTMSPGDRAENEKFGLEYEGPKLNDKDARKLLTLMLHASTCPCRHECSKAQEVCRSAKWMMLHVRDCPGTTVTDDVCPFPWCRKVKHLLYHLVSCTVQQECPICCGSGNDYNWSRLRHLNAFRMKLARENLVQGFSERDNTINNQQQQQQRSVGVKKPAAAATSPQLTARPLQPLPVESVKVHPKASSVPNTVAAISGAMQSRSQNNNDETTADPVVSGPSAIPTSVVCINNACSRDEVDAAKGSSSKKSGSSDVTVEIASPDTLEVKVSKCIVAVPEVKKPIGHIGTEAVMEEGAPHTLVVPLAATSGQVDEKTVEVR